MTDTHEPESPAPSEIDGGDVDIDIDIEDERVRQRQALTAEEQAAGSDDPATQAQVILIESEERTLDPDGDHGSFDEHRHSEDTV